MTQTAEKQNILVFIDSYKYDSAALLEDLRSYPGLETQIRRELERVSDVGDWPVEFRNWRAALFGLMASDVAGIAHPMLRERAAKRLFSNAVQFGMSAAMVKMICGEIYPVRLKLEHSEIDIPREVTARRADQGDADER